MLKKFAFGLFALLLALGAAACSNGEDKEAAEQAPAVEAPAEETPAEEAAPAEDAAVERLKAVNSVAIAEDKVNTLFHHDAAEDGTPLLNATTGTPEAAKELLLGYFDPAVADRIIAHYVAAPATEAGVVVNEQKFFASSVVGVAPEELKIEGDKAGGFTIATKDGAKFTVKWNEEQGRYIVANVE